MQQCAKNEGVDLDVYSSLMDMGSISTLNCYDGAIIDYNLSDSTGVETAECLSLLFRDIPVVLVSGTDRSPTDEIWPACVKQFMNKSEGYARVLKAIEQNVQEISVPFASGNLRNS